MSSTLFGYGIKSIKYTADRYDGAVYISAKDNWFDIKIAIPMATFAQGDTQR